MAHSEVDGHIDSANGTSVTYTDSNGRTQEGTASGDEVSANAAALVGKQARIVLDDDGTTILSISAI